MTSHQSKAGVCFVLVFWLVFAQIPLQRRVVYAQGNTRCAAELIAADRAVGNAKDLQDEQDKQEEEFATLTARAVQTSRQISSVRNQIGNIDALEFFAVAGSDTRKKLDDIRKTLEARLKLLTDQQAKLTAAIPLRMAEYVRLRDDADIAQRTATEAIARLSRCMNGTPITSVAPLTSSTPAVSTGGSIYELVDFTPDPKQPYGGWTWTAGGGQINYHDPSGMEETFQWSQPPQRFGADGFPIELHVSAKSLPKNRALAGIHVGGDFERKPDTGIEALSENGQAVSKDIRILVSPSRPVASPGDYYVRIGADYGPSFVYHYRVNR